MQRLTDVRTFSTRYTSGSDLNSLSYSGARFDSYGGGGYVHKIEGTYDAAREDLRNLQRQRWINNHTRAVFLEFSTWVLAIYYLLNCFHYAYKSVQNVAVTITIHFQLQRQC